MFFEQCFSKCCFPMDYFFLCLFGNTSRAQAAPEGCRRERKANELGPDTPNSNRCNMAPKSRHVASLPWTSQLGAIPAGSIKWGSLGYRFLRHCGALSSPELWALAELQYRALRSVRIESTTCRDTCVGCAWWILCLGNGV